ncbi:MAG: hypothetical protein AABY18_03125 [Candidatus Thermoplasmatota archaeon]
MLARILEVRYAQAEAQHRARDPVDLADPLFHAIGRAEKAQAKSLATPEQTLAELVLKMRLVDAMKR